MAGCPLNDAELEGLVGRVAELLEQGHTATQVMEEIGDLGWEEAEVTALIGEVDARRQELGRAPNGCRLLCQSACLQARSGILFSFAGAVAISLSAIFDRYLPIMIVGGALCLYGLVLALHACARLKKYQN